MQAESEQFCNPSMQPAFRMSHEVTWTQRPDGSRFGKCSLCNKWVGIRLSKEVERIKRMKGKKIRATFSNAPCTSSCWHAEGDVCVCSCYGKNHGIGHNPEQE